ncbi:hypothetical protein LD856_06520, partial [Salmonella enterica]|nr:hypothetical protein [Salmonella enterica]MDJ7124686.1 hypothetical protein [Salmonella enterica]MDJ7786408.1 hypothetical protein [Salmonella enterica]
VRITKVIQRRYLENCIWGDGIICSCAKDVSMLYPVDMSVTEVEALPTGFDADLTWRFDGISIVKIPQQSV